MSIAKLAVTLTLAVTFIATLSIRLEVAILIGVLVSLLVYLHRTTHPRLTRVLRQWMEHDSGYPANWMPSIIAVLPPLAIAPSDFS